MLNINFSLPTWSTERSVMLYSILFRRCMLMLCSILFTITRWI